MEKKVRDSKSQDLISFSSLFRLGLAFSLLVTLLATNFTVQTTFAATWTSQTSNTTNNLKGIDCVNTQVCYTSGLNSTVVSTSNGGTNWTATNNISNTSYYFYNISCGDANNCVAVGSNNDIKSCAVASFSNPCLSNPVYSVVATTANGGSTWAVQLFSNDGDSDNALYDVNCFDALHCYAVGVSININIQQFSATANEVVRYTSNGGTTWQKQTLAAGGFGGMDCVDSDHCYAVGAEGNISSQNPAVEYTANASANISSTWTAQTLPSSSATSGKLLYSISCPDLQHCYTVGDSGLIFATSNGGSTWTLQSSNTSERLNRIACVSVTTCFVGGDSGDVIATFNGGQTWETVYTDPQGSAINSIACPTADSCFIAGDGGVIELGTSLVPTQISATSGSNQTTTVNTAFANELQATVLDGDGKPAAGVPVTFTIQSDMTSGAGASFSNGSSQVVTVTNSSGIATSPVITANSSAGDYTATAATALVSSMVTFTLHNSAATTPSPTPTSTTYTYYLPFLANNYNGFTTYLAFQNIGTAQAHYTLQFYDPSGSVISSTAQTTSNCSTLQVYGECIASNPYGSSTSATHGSGILSSDQPLAVIVPEATPYGGSAYAVQSGSANSLVVPFAINGAYGGYYTQINVFNGGDNSATVTLKFYNQDGTDAPVASTQVFTLTAHTSASFAQNDANSGLPAPTTNYAGFNGWAQISSTSGSVLAAQVLEQNPTAKFVAIANAISSGAKTLYAPAIFNNGYGSFFTGANLINSNSSAVSVTLTYYDKDTGTASTAAPFNLAAHAVQGIFDGGTGIGLPTNGLANPFIGAAVVTATDNIVMSVNENGGLTAAGNARSGTYAALTNGGSSVGLPVASNGGYTYITGATIFNTSSAPVTATIQYYDINGNLQTGTTQTFTVQPKASQAFYQGAANLPANFYGTAVITESADSPANALIVTTNAQSSTLFYTYSEPNP